MRCHSILSVYANRTGKQERLQSEKTKSSWVHIFPFSSVAQSCLTLYDPMNHSTPGLPVHHQLLEFTQTPVRWVGVAIQPSHPLLSPSPPAPSPSQHQGFYSESTLHMKWPKYWSFSFSITPSNEYSALISFRIDWLDLLAVQGGLGRDSRESFPTPQFRSISFSVLNFLYSPTLISIYDCWKNHSFDYMDLCWQRNVSAF